MAPMRPPARRFQRTAYADQTRGQQRARADAHLGPQDAGLRGQHQQQHDADQGHRHTGDREQLADPALVRVRAEPLGQRGRGGGGGAEGTAAAWAGGVAGGRVRAAQRHGDAGGGGTGGRRRCGRRAGERPLQLGELAATRAICATSR